MTSSVSSLPRNPIINVSNDGTPSSTTVRLAYHTYFSLLNGIVSDATHVIPVMSIATRPTQQNIVIEQLRRSSSTNIPPTTAFQKHKPPPPLLLQTLDLGEAVPLPTALSSVTEDDPPTSTPSSTPTKPTCFSRMMWSFRRGSSLF